MSKTERLNIRVTEEQLALLKQAAAANGQTVSDYVLSHVLADARDDLTDRRLFSLDAAEWTEFTSRLDRPPTPKPELEDLLAHPTPWADAEGEVAPGGRASAATRRASTPRRGYGDHVAFVVGTGGSQIWVSADAIPRERLPGVLRAAQPDFTDRLIELLESVGVAGVEDDDVPAARAD
ncbi:MAG TPA: DUF1778 domain-containing protein [Acidimicrobiales bacterium]